MTSGGQAEIGMVSDEMGEIGMIEDMMVGGGF